MRNIQCTISLLTTLGFFISEKSVLSPTKQLIFLGFVLDSEAMTITLTDKRKGKILSAAKVMASTPTQRIRMVAALMGMIIAALPGVKHGQLHYRRLEIRIWPCSTRKAIIIKHDSLSMCCPGRHLVVHYSLCVLLFHAPPPPPQSSPITSIQMLALWVGGLQTPR